MLWVWITISFGNMPRVWLGTKLIAKSKQEVKKTLTPPCSNKHSMILNVRARGIFIECIRPSPSLARVGSIMMIIYIIKK